jgi:uncharacterized protein YdhG (YjbR/CyaY superfamily)
MQKINANSIDEYIAAFPKNIQKKLEQLRRTISKAAPEAKEIINYGIPTFTLEGNLVHFAAYDSHIGFYPTPSGIEAFKKDLSPYKLSKGTVQIPLDQPLPLELISRIIQFRVKENLERAAFKRSLKGGKKSKPKEDFLSLLSSPARRALENHGITSLNELSGYSEAEILALHGMGKSSVPKLREALEAEGLSFKE